MKFVLVAIVVSSLLLPTILSTKAHAAGFDDASSVCLLVAENDKKRLRKLLKDMHLKIKTLYSSVTCNGMNLVRFALHNKSDDVGMFLIKKIPASSLRESADLDWANTNGYESSAVTQALIERLQ